MFRHHVRPREERPSGFNLHREEWHVYCAGQGLWKGSLDPILGTKRLMKSLSNRYQI